MWSSQLSCGELLAVSAQATGLVCPHPERDPKDELVIGAWKGLE